MRGTERKKDGERGERQAERRGKKENDRQID